MKNKQYLEQLEKILQEFNRLKGLTDKKDLSNLPREGRQALIMKAIAAIHRITGTNSSYSAQLATILRQMPSMHNHMTSVMGVVRALFDDLKAGYLDNFTEIIHGEVFTDYLEMAKYLLNSGYKDAAAVIAGATLENHLRSLAIKFSVERDENSKRANAEKLNNELLKQGAYEIGDQKSITSWLHLRNKAAHAEYNEYDSKQVALLIDSVQNFVTRTPA